jgi:hypothetical protein
MGSMVSYSYGTIDELFDLISKYNSEKIEGVYSVPLNDEALAALNGGGIIVTDLGGKDIHIFSNVETREQIEKILTINDRPVKSGVH